MRPLNPLVTDEMPGDVACRSKRWRTGALNPRHRGPMMTSGRRPWRRSAALAALIVCATAAMTGSATAAVVTGVSDENLDRWDPVAQDVFNALNVPQVRHVVPWNVALDPAGVAGVRRWIAATHGKQVLISFGAAADRVLPAASCASGDPAPCPTANYRFAIDQFRAAFPDVTEFTAWNEPNHPLGGVNPTGALAAGYWNQLDAACQVPSSTGHTCTVAAGDFSDFNSLTTYVDGYRAGLRRTPDVWAVHAYDAINDVAADDVSKLQAWATNETDNKPIWITEVGAYYCTQNNPISPNAAGTQVSAGSNLKALTLPRLARVYYYFLAPGAGAAARCPFDPNNPSVSEDDPGLIGAGDTIRPALTTLFPSLSAPSAQTATASDVIETQATFNGTLNSNGVRTTYRFEYGPTTSYGSSVPTSEVAGGSAGAQPVTAVVSGLRPATAYHYRLVASNALGSSAGADQTFTTSPMPQPAVVVKPDGEKFVIYRTLNGQLEVWHWNGAWSSQTFGFANTVAGDPSAVLVPNGRVYVIYRTPSGQLGRFWTDGVNWNFEDLHLFANTVAGNPSAVALPNGRVEVVYRTTNGQLGRFWYLDPNWNSEDPHLFANTIAGDPAAVLTPNGRIEVVYRTTNGQLGRFWYLDPNWNSEDPHLFANTIAGDPSPVVLPTGRVETIYRMTNGQLGRFWYLDPNWNSEDPHLFANTMAGDPSAAREASGRIDVAYRSTTGQLGTFWYQDPNWNPATVGLSDTVAGDPTTVIDTDGREQVFYAGSDGQYHYATVDNATGTATIQTLG